MPIPDSDRSTLLRGLPSIDRILRDPPYEGIPRPVLAREARSWIEKLRELVLAGELDAEALQHRCRTDEEGGVLELLQRCAQAERPRHERVINATGVVLHTGLGRAPLASKAVEAIAAVAGYGIVEVDPRTGQRDQREAGTAELLKDITGAGGALVVNNNAAAVTLALTALCFGREVVISRGELVEIGGGFRVPDVMRRAGCHMVEVGATNKTHLADFEQATNEATAAWMKVHPSNFRIEGFASTPTVAELAELARDRELMILDDLGSGLLWNEPIAGLRDEPRVADSLAAGAHVTCFSGDKLLGGPQCGILVGHRDLVANCRAHPLYRALRCDKLILAGLEATLRLYRDGDPLAEVPVLRMLSATADELRARSKKLLQLLRGRMPEGLEARVVESESFAGSGANPAKPLPSWSVALPGGRGLFDALRDGRPTSVFARVADGQVLLDARSLLLEDVGEVAGAVQRALS